jgi:hypothetical protein
MLAMNGIFKTFLVTFIFCVLVSPLAAQRKNSQKLIPFKVGNKWGYLNHKGKIAIAPQFKDADYFYEGLAAVQIDEDFGLYGFIDEKGKFVIEPQFSDTHEFSEGLAPVLRLSPNNLWEYIDYQGKTVIEARFAFAMQFSEGLADVLIKSPETDSFRHAYIDKTGKFAFEAQFDWADPFSDGLARIAPLLSESKSEHIFTNMAFIDKSGNRVTPVYDTVSEFNEGLAAIKIDNLWGFINTSGSLAIPAEFGFADDFSEGFSAYSYKTEEPRQYGFIDKKGNRLTDCIFLAFHDFSEGLAPVQTENKLWGFIDAKGRFAIKPQFSDTQGFYNELAEVTIVNDKGIEEQAYINHKGEILVNISRLNPTTP